MKSITLRLNPEKIPFKDVDGTMLDPLIVIVTEGVSLLSISRNTQNPNYRNAKYFNENPIQTPIIINWKRFQEDFKEDLTFFQRFWDISRKTYAAVAGPQPAPTDIQQLMKIDHFIDYVVYPMRTLGRRICIYSETGAQLLPSTETIR